MGSQRTFLWQLCPRFGVHSANSWKSSWAFPQATMNQWWNWAYKSDPGELPQKRCLLPAEQLGELASQSFLITITLENLHKLHHSSLFMDNSASFLFCTSWGVSSQYLSNGFSAELRIHYVRPYLIVRIPSSVSTPKESPSFLQALS